MIRNGKIKWSRWPDGTISKERSEIAEFPCSFAVDSSNFRFNENVLSRSGSDLYYTKKNRWILAKFSIIWLAGASSSWGFRSKLEGRGEVFSVREARRSYYAEVRRRLPPRFRCAHSLSLPRKLYRAFATLCSPSTVIERTSDSQVLRVNSVMLRHCFVRIR